LGYSDFGRSDIGILIVLFHFFTPTILYHIFIKRWVKSGREKYPKARQRNVAGIDVIVFGTLLIIYFSCTSIISIIAYSII
jgi:hypothetical protein